MVTQGKQVHQAAERVRFQTAMSVYYVALFLPIAIYTPYAPVWFAARGLPASAIAAAAALPMFIRVAVAPAAGLIADMTGRPRTVIALSAALSLLAAIGLALSQGTGPVLAGVLIYSAVWAPLIPLSESFTAQGSAAAGADYARIRMCGSASFIAGSLAMGAALDWLPGEAVISVLIGVLALQLAALLLLPPQRTAAGGAARLRLSDAGALLKRRDILVFLAAGGLCQASHAVFYAFGSLHWQALGYSGRATGFLWAAGVVMEVSFFAVAGRVFSKVDPARLIALGAAAGVLRWGVTAFDPPLWLLVPLQGLHALTFACNYFACVQFILKRVPGQLAATAQALTSACSTALIGVMTLAAGAIYGTAGGLTYLLMAGLSLAAFGAALLLERVSPRVPVPADR